MGFTTFVLSMGKTRGQNNVDRVKNDTSIQE